jgi:uncharacterized lipoprotein YmbA
MNGRFSKKDTFLAMNAKTFPANPSANGERSRLRRRFLPAWALMAVTATVLGGCQLLPPGAVDTTRFFVLSASPLPATEPTVARPSGGLQIGLRPVELPAYLRATKSMVVRDGANEIRYQDYARWAEPLESGVNRVLMEKLQASPAVAGVDAHPLRGDVARDYLVTIRILRCEGVTGEAASVRFAASYEIAPVAGAEGVTRSRTYMAPDRPWDGKDFNALASLLSDAVNGLGDQIVADLAL